MAPQNSRERELYGKKKKMKKRKREPQRRGEEGKTGGKSCGPEESKCGEENMVRRNGRVEKQKNKNPSRPSPLSLLVLAVTRPEAKFEPRVCLFTHLQLLLAVGV